MLQKGEKDRPNAADSILRSDNQEGLVKQLALGRPIEGVAGAAQAGELRERPWNAQMLAVGVVGVAGVGAGA